MTVRKVARSSQYLLLLLITIFYFSATTTLGEIQENTFLPFVIYLIQPTPTFTPTPTLPAPENPALDDGYYEASLPNGYLWFTVSDNGSLASSAAFYYSNLPWCSAAYSFSGLTRDITDGGFNFFVIDFQNREAIASLGCQSISSASANCTAHKFGSDCPSASGTAKKK